MEKPLHGKPKAGFPLRLGIPQKTRDSHFPTAMTAAIRPPPSWKFKTKPRVLTYDWTKNGGQVRLNKMSTTLNESLKTSGGMASATRKQLDILQQEQADRAAQLAKKPQLELLIGSMVVPTVFNAADPLSFPVRDQSDTSITFDARLVNPGSGPATKVQLRIILLAKDVVFSSDMNTIQTFEPPESPARTYLINFDFIRQNVNEPMTMTFSFPKGHAPFQVVFNVDADEIQTGTPLGTVLVTPRAPTN